MFKTLSIALISLLGMNYANDSGHNIRLNASIRDDTAVVGGTAYDKLDTGFYKIDADFRYGPLTVDYAPYQNYSYAYSSVFQFKADYVFFKSGSIIYETNNFKNLVLLQSNATDGLLVFEFRSLFKLELSENDEEIDGLGQYLEGLENNDYTLYLENPIVERIPLLVFLQDNNSFVVNDVSHTTNKLLPLVKDDRFTWINRDFTFGSQPLGLGYYDVSDNDYFKLGFAVQSSANQIDRVFIFKGLFSSFDTLFDTYSIDYMQNINGSNYFGSPNIEKLSDAIHLTNSMYFYPFAGMYHQIGYASNTGYVPIWFTQNVQLGTSGTVNTVITNNQYFRNDNFRTMHLYYQLNDFENHTFAYSKDWLGLLSYNPNSNIYPGGEGSESFNNVFELLGLAFRQLWNIGNIALIGSITLNTLIILPLVISLVLFIIHLIKKG